jgi:hypothetical protein
VVDGNCGGPRPGTSPCAPLPGRVRNPLGSETVHLEVGGTPGPSRGRGTVFSISMEIAMGVFGFKTGRFRLKYPLFWYTEVGERKRCAPGTQDAPEGSQLGADKPGVPPPPCGLAS